MFYIQMMMYKTGRMLGNGYSRDAAIDVDIYKVISKLEASGNR